MAAKRKEIRKIRLDETGVDLSGLPALQVSRLYLPDSGKKAEMLQGDPETVVAQLVDKLRKEARVI